MKVATADTALETVAPTKATFAKKVAKSIKTVMKAKIIPQATEAIDKVVKGKAPTAKKVAEKPAAMKVEKTKAKFAKNVAKSIKTAKTVKSMPKVEKVEKNKNEVCQERGKVNQDREDSKVNAKGG